MKALIKFQLDLKPGKTGDTTVHTVFAEKEVSVPILPQVGMRIDGFEVFKDLEELMNDDRENGRLGVQHGFEIKLVEFDLRSDTMIPVIWLWVEYEKFLVGDNVDDDEWCGLDAKQAFLRLFKPQFDKYNFRIIYNPFNK